MKRVVIITAVLVVALVALLTLPSRREQPLTYQPDKEAQVSGTVQQVEEYFCPLTEDRGTHLVLKTDQGNLTVHVALARFLRRNNIAFAAGDKVDILGSRVASDVVIARQVTRGNDVFILRDGSGKPVWQ